MITLCNMVKYYPSSNILISTAQRGGVRNNIVYQSSLMVKNAAMTVYLVECSYITSIVNKYSYCSV